MPASTRTRCVPMPCRTDRNRPLRSGRSPRQTALTASKTMADRIVLSSPAAVLGQLVQRREVSALELARWSLEGLETRGRSLNAVAELTADLALEQATQADREIAAGRIRG